MFTVLSLIARRLRRGVPVLAIVAMIGSTSGSFAMAPATVAPTAVPPVPPGMARIWFYRDYEPYLSLARPYTRLNGGVIGVSEPGEAFYRDVAPGTYEVTVDSEGRDIYQFANIAVGSGQQVFIKVMVSVTWDSGGGALGSSWQRDTFYTRQIPPADAMAAISQMPLYTGG